MTIIMVSVRGSYAVIIAVCDDNETERYEYSEKITNVLKKEFPNVDMQTYSNGKQMLFEFDSRENIPDIIFLDILMPEMGGIEVANRLRAKGFDGEIIFLTQSEDYWQHAFDVHAYHYILKNDCTEEKFEKILSNAVKSVLEKNEDCILFSSYGETLSIRLRDIYYFEVRGRIIVVFYAGGSFEFYSSLSKLEEQLSERNFIRIHRSYLVSKSYIAKTFYNNVILKDNTRLPVGRAYKNIVTKVFEKGESN